MKKMRRRRKRRRISTQLRGEAGFS